MLLKGQTPFKLYQTPQAIGLSLAQECGNFSYKKYVDAYGYYDIFLINPDGYCFYTAAKESDYQTNFTNGQYRDSNLGVLFRDVLETKNYGIADFAPYAPSNNEPAAFIAKPLSYEGKSKWWLPCNSP